jgi:glutamine synthetase
VVWRHYQKPLGGKRMIRNYEPKEVIKKIKEEKGEFVDLRFSDLFGKWQHITYHVSKINLDTFKRGIGFDSSSIRAFSLIQKERP